MDFLIHAPDLKDAQAKDRRLKAREAHLTAARKLYEEGHFIAGGALLSPEGEMRGSTLYLRFASREVLMETLKKDPYTLGRVWDWDQIRIEEIKLVDFTQ